MDSAPRPRPFATDVRPRMPPQHPVTDSMHVGTLGGDPHVGHEASSHVVPEGVSRMALPPSPTRLALSRLGPGLLIWHQRTVEVSRGEGVCSPLRTVTWSRKGHLRPGFLPARTRGTVPPIPRFRTVRKG